MLKCFLNVLSDVRLCKNEQGRIRKVRIIIWINGILFKDNIERLKQLFFFFYSFC